MSRGSQQVPRVFVRASTFIYQEGVMEQIAKVNDYISVPDCATIGTVKDIKAGGRDAISPDPMPIYEIETSQGMMRIPADWLAKLIRPGLEAGRAEPFHNATDGM